MNKIRQAIQAGLPSLGVWQALSTPLAGELLARNGFDWILIDTQHGGATWDALAGLIYAVEAAGNVAVVRVGANDPMLITRALDLGAVAVVVPLVSTGAEARRAVEATRYPPLGNRSFGQIRKFQSVEAANADAFCLVMIETAEAMENLEAIAATPGVDGLFIGPADLGLSLGCGLSAAMPDALLAAVDRVVAAANRNGIVAGCVSSGSKSATDLLQRGIRFLTLGSDLGYVMTRSQEDAQAAEELRRRFGGKGGSS